MASPPSTGADGAGGADGVDAERAPASREGVDGLVAPSGVAAAVVARLPRTRSNDATRTLSRLPRARAACVAADDSAAAPFFFAVSISSSATAS